MIIAKEITDWDYNHTYLLSKDKMKCHGYWKNSNKKEYIEFIKPLSFDKRGRKFIYKEISKK